MKNNHENFYFKSTSTKNFYVGVEKI